MWKYSLVIYLLFVENLHVQTVYHKSCVAKISCQLKRQICNFPNDWTERAEPWASTVLTFVRNESSGSQHWAIVLQISRGWSQYHKSGQSPVGGGVRTLNFHPGGSEPEWVQSYYYAPGKYSHAPLRIRIKPNWAPVSTENVSVTLNWSFCLSSSCKKCFKMREKKKENYNNNNNDKKQH